MTNGEFPPPDESDAWLTPRWQQVNNDPVVVAAEQQLAAIKDVRRQKAELTDELRNYFWNGRPYSRQLGGQRGEEPADWQWGPSDPNDPYKFNPANIVSDEPALDGEARIIQARDRLAYLVNQDGVLLSPGYLWLKHRAERDFEIPSHARGGLVHLLSTDEQNVIEDKDHQRVELNQQLHGDLQEATRSHMHSLVPAILDHYSDIDQRSLRILHSFDSVHIEFSYAGHQVELIDYQTAGVQLVINSADRPEPVDFTFHTDQLSHALPIALAFVRQPIFSNCELMHRDAYLEVSQPGLLTVKDTSRPETYAVGQALHRLPPPDHLPRYFALNPDQNGVEWLEEIGQGQS